MARPRWAFSLALLALLLLAAKKRELPPRLLADNQGQLAHVLTHFADYDNIPTLYGFLHQLPPRTRVTIAVPAGERTRLLQALLQGWGLKAHRRIKVLSLQEPMNFWIRDEFVVAQGRHILLPKRFGLKTIPESIEQLNKSAPIKVTHTLLEFDGGNVVVGEKSVFVGFNLIQKNLGDLFSTPAEILEYLQQLFGKPVVVVGNQQIGVPHDHIDMILTPLKKDQLLLGDPRLAIELLKNHRQLLTTTYSKIYFNEKSTPLSPMAKDLLFSTADFMKRLQKDIGVRDPHDVMGEDDLTLAVLFAKNALPENLNRFDALVLDLASKGYRDIVRIPVLMNHDLDNGPFITYNNLLIDQNAQQSTAYLPKYNIPPLDDHAKTTLERAGFKVKAVDVQNISFYNGTLRCVTQVLERS